MKLRTCENALSFEAELEGPVELGRQRGEDKPGPYALVPAGERRPRAPLTPGPRG